MVRFRVSFSASEKYLVPFSSFGKPFDKQIWKIQKSEKVFVIGQIQEIVIQDEDTEDRRT